MSLTKNYCHFYIPAISKTTMLLNITEHVVDGVVSKWAEEKQKMCKQVAQRMEKLLHF